MITLYPYQLLNQSTNSYFHHPDFLIALVTIVPGSIAPDFSPGMEKYNRL